MQNPNLDELLSSSIDMHLHIGPDEMQTRVDAVEASEQAADAEMKAIVLKNHSYPTTPVALNAQDFVPEVKVFGSVCLDYEIGGLNVGTLERQAQFGAKVVWMPTFSSTNSRAKKFSTSTIWKNTQKHLPTNLEKCYPAKTTFKLIFIIWQNSSK